MSSDATDNTIRAELADSALAHAIEATCTGRAEWRVQNPVDGSYCIAFDRSQSTLPKGEAEAWLADHKRRFPDSQFAGYEVAKVRVFDQAEELALDAARRLRARADTARQAAQVEAQQLKAEVSRLKGFEKRYEAIRADVDRRVAEAVAAALTCTTAMAVAMELDMDNQVEASGLDSGLLHRQDGFRLWDAAIRARSTPTPPTA